MRDEKAEYALRGRGFDYHGGRRTSRFAGSRRQVKRPAGETKLALRGAYDAKGDMSAGDACQRALARRDAVSWLGEGVYGDT